MGNSNLFVRKVVSATVRSAMNNSANTMYPAWLLCALGDIGVQFDAASPAASNFSALGTSGGILLNSPSYNSWGMWRMSKKGVFLPFTVNSASRIAAMGAYGYKSTSTDLARFPSALNLSPAYENLDYADQSQALDIGLAFSPDDGANHGYVPVASPSVETQSSTGSIAQAQITESTLLGTTWGVVKKVLAEPLSGVGFPASTGFDFTLFPKGRWTVGYQNSVAWQAIFGAPSPPNLGLELKYCAAITDTMAMTVSPDITSNVLPLSDDQYMVVPINPSAHPGSIAWVNPSTSTTDGWNIVRDIPLNTANQNTHAIAYGVMPLSRFYANPATVMEQTYNLSNIVQLNIYGGVLYYYLDVSCTIQYSKSPFTDVIHKPSLTVAPTVSPS